MRKIQEPGAIVDWHAHIYFTSPAERETAALLREELGARFPTAVLGRWHEQKVGPHPVAMYQVHFAPADLPAMLPYLALNRDGLTILVHPNTERPKDDHLLHAVWLGAVLPLDASVLPEVARHG
jgi:DOPA 4,5-dioxygenase